MGFPDVIKLLLPQTFGLFVRLKTEKNIVQNAGFGSPN